MSKESSCKACGFLTSWRKTTRYDYVKQKSVTAFRCNHCNALRPEEVTPDER